MRNAISRKLESVHQKGALRSVRVANIIDTRPESVSRWNQGQAFPRPDAEKLLIDLEYIVGHFADLCEPRDVRMWLFSCRKVLTGEIPADLLQKGRASDVIESRVTEFTCRPSQHDPRP